MVALQSDVLELKANAEERARGRVIESEMHKGMGPKATVLVINGSLKKGDSLVFEQHYGRVKTMHDDLGRDLQIAGPSHPVEITGLSGLPEAGQEFIVVSSEKEARSIVEMRLEELKSKQAKKKIASFESIMEQGQKSGKKILNLVLRADVQGSFEAIKTALEKIESTKCDLNIIYAGVGEISESDVQLASASKAMILGFHTQVESHAESLIKLLGIQVKTHDIIYHAVDEVKLAMKGLLDKIELEKETGKAEVKATFKSSQLGIIAGCQVIEGTIYRNNFVRIRRNNEILLKGTIASLKKVKEDVREVPKGQECGILISNFSQFEVGDIIEAFEITYLTQEL
jgi:translation initiation factor IF-2